MRLTTSKQTNKKTISYVVHLTKQPLNTVCSQKCARAFAVGLFSKRVFGIFCMLGFSICWYFLYVGIFCMLVFISVPLCRHTHTHTPPNNCGAKQGAVLKGAMLEFVKRE